MGVLVALYGVRMPPADVSFSIVEFLLLPDGYNLSKYQFASVHFLVLAAFELRDSSGRNDTPFSCSNKKV